MPKLQIACNTPVSDGMVVHTQNEKVDTGRAMILELLLVNHPLDCPICDKGGECDLQDYAMAYARGTSDVVDPKSRKPKGVDLGPTIVLDEERCVVCQRCVRFDDIIAGEEQLVVKDRGAHDIIATATGDPYHHNFTGNVTEICPGRRADLEDLSLQVAPVGPASHADELHAVFGRLSDVLRRALRYSAADDVGGTRRRDLRRLAVRPRPLQYRVLRVARAVDAADVQEERRLRANRLGRCVRAVGEGHQERDARIGRAGRGDRRRPADRTKKPT